MKKKKTGELYKEMGFRDEKHFKTSQINFYNEIDPTLIDSFIIEATPENPWKLKYYQDPKSIKLIRANHADRSEVAAMGVTVPGKIGLITRQDTIIATIDLNIPLDLSLRN